MIQSHTCNFKPIKKPFLASLLTTILCSLSYLGSYFTFSVRETHHNQHCIQLQQHNVTTQNHISQPLLQFEAHHFLSLPRENPQSFKLCRTNFTHYCPCQDLFREKQFLFGKNFHIERHCPEPSERLRCLIPRPVGYKKPISWPESRDSVWFNNVPFPKLTEYKKSQNWVRLEGDRFVFPGGGTSFPKGVKGYVDSIKRFVPLKSGNVRTVLDTGCGVASFAAALMDYNILTMSIAPRDAHEAQVQFALERGLPAMLGVLSTYRLPFPSRSFDMAHCSRCLIPWNAYEGMYLLEIDRVLRPGGYWVLSGPPISWKVSYKGWKVEPQVLEKDQKALEDLARRMCWKKIAERETIAVWQKPTNHIHCIQKLRTWKSLEFCTSSDADAGWYTKMVACISPLPDVKYISEISGGALEKWPKRLNVAPPRIGNGQNDEIMVKTFSDDNRTWKRRVSYYEVILKSLAAGKFRNVMDMNAGFGGFAAAMVKHPVWVMNVVPFDARNSSLGAIYERGLIGTYMDWCEPFSTYPRTYDLIHASGLFSMYRDKCDIIDILIEMHRILRPFGAVIIRDHADVVVKVKKVTDQIRWSGKILHSENGPYHSEKVLIVDNSD